MSFVRRHPINFVGCRLIVDKSILMDFSSAVIEDDSLYIFTPERGDQIFTVKSILEIESIIRRYPPF
jgi:hypothetical protein